MPTALNHLAFVEPFGVKYYEWEKLSVECRLALRVYGVPNLDKRVYGVVDVPMVPLQQYIMEVGAAELRHFPSFEEYHKWYVEKNTVLPYGDFHYPCILSTYEDEVFEDGWHRFHSYYRDRRDTVKCLSIGDIDDKV